MLEKKDVTINLTNVETLALIAALKRTEVHWMRLGAARLSEEYRALGKKIIQQTKEQA